MKKLFNVMAVFSVAAMIFGAVACNSNVSAAFKDFEILYENVPTGNDVTFGDIIQIEATFNDGSKKIIAEGGFESSKALSDKVEVGLNEFSVTYRNVTKSVTIFKASHVTTDALVEVAADASYSQGTNKRYFKFGDYAQTKATVLPSSVSEKPASNGWYIGDNGKYYGKVGDDLYDVTPILWCEVTTNYDYDGHSEDNTVTTNTNTGNVDTTFSECPNKGSLLIAESILEGGVPYYYQATDKYTAETLEDLKQKDSNIRSINGIDDIFTNNYEFSQIRAFLNGLDYYDLDNKVVSGYKNVGFLNSAFSPVAQEKLITVDVLNDNKSGTDTMNTPLKGVNRYYTLSSSTTKDKVFILSNYEATFTAYGFGYGNEAKTSRKRITTAYSTASGAADSKYWLRTPYYSNGCSVRYVSSDFQTYLNTLVNDPTIGVVPAIVVNTPAAK